MRKVNISNPVPDWNNIKPVYVKSTSSNPFVVPVWLVSASITISTLISIIERIIAHTIK